jgi:hypothetical protein
MCVPAGTPNDDQIATLGISDEEAEKTLKKLKAGPTVWCVLMCISSPTRYLFREATPHTRPLRQQTFACDPSMCVTKLRPQQRCVSHCAHCIEAGLSVLVFGFAVYTTSPGLSRR